MFTTPELLFKNGELIVRNGKIIKVVNGGTHVMRGRPTIRASRNL